MKKGDIVEGRIEKVEFPGKGILQVEGERIVVKNVIPGQKVQVRVTKKRKGRCEGTVLEVLEKAPGELSEGICSHFDQCGGCIYQNLPYEAQVELKERQIRELLASVCPGVDGAIYMRSDDHRVGQGRSGLMGQVAAGELSPAVDQPPYQGAGGEPEDEPDSVWQGLKPSPVAEGYRNKLEFSFGDAYKGGPLALGMHRKGSFYDIVTTEACRIVHPDFCKILAVTRDYFAGLGVPFYRKLQHQGFLRHLLVRRAVKTGEILVDLVTTSQTGWVLALDGIREGEAGHDGLERAGREAGRSEQGTDPKDGKIDGLQAEGRGDGVVEQGQAGQDPGQREQQAGLVQQIIRGWAEKIRACEEEGALEGKLAGVLHTWNDSLADVVQNDRTDVLFGQDFFYEELLGLRFKITPFSFFQTNSLGAEVLYDTVREYVGETKDKTIFDLYSGTGTIAQILAPVAGQVTGVEIVEEAVEAARENAARNGLENCRFIAGDVLKVVDELKEKPDLIVLDPPRDGIHPKALPKIIRFGVEKIVYVSCKPTSLVRDLAVLMEAGYQVEKACAVDMFPGTGGIETVCSLTKICPGRIYLYPG